MVTPLRADLAAFHQSLEVHALEHLHAQLWHIFPINDEGVHCFVYPELRFAVSAPVYVLGDVLFKNVFPAEAADKRREHFVDI